MSFDRQAERFADIVDNIDRIKAHMALLNGQPLQESSVVADAVERCLSRISEAVSVLMRLDCDLNLLSAEVPWKRIHNFGNVLRHSYWDVEGDLVAEIIAHHLDQLRTIAADEVERLDRKAGL